MSGDDQHFLAVAHLVESHTFRDEDADTPSSSGSSSPVPALGKSIPHSDSTVQGLQSAISKLTAPNDAPTSFSTVSQTNTEVLGPEAMTSDVSSAVVLVSPSGDRSAEPSVGRSSARSPIQKVVIENVHVRRLAALENCLVAFER